MAYDCAGRISLWSSVPGTFFPGFDDMAHNQGRDK